MTTPIAVAVAVGKAVSVYRQAVSVYLQVARVTNTLRVERHARHLLVLHLLLRLTLHLLTVLRIIPTQTQTVILAVAVATATITATTTAPGI